MNTISDTHTAASRAFFLFILGLALLAMACKSDAPPPESTAQTPPEQVQFRLPAYKDMPACAIVLQAEPDTDWGLNPTETRTNTANAAYLAVRDCPDAVESLKANGTVFVPLNATAKGLQLDVARLDDAAVGALVGPARTCVSDAISKRPKPDKNGLSLSASVYIQLPDNAHAP